MVGVILPLIVFALIGVVHLPHPLHGDAALYQAGARALASGATLYRDFWDLKQPGVYLFHLAAGRLFAFSEVGVHALELVTLLAVALVQVRLLRHALNPPWLANFAPIASMGGYYLVTTSWHLTQPAVLLSAPLVLLLSVMAAPSQAPVRWLLAGGAVALALVFKMAMAPLVAAMALGGLLFEATDRRRDGSALPLGALLGRRLLPLLAGALVVTLGALLWLRLQGGWEALVWTHTSWRSEALAVRGRLPASRIVASTRWFVTQFAPWIALAMLSPLSWRGLRAERVFVLSALWLGVGGVLVMLEPFAGWEFDFLILIVPLGALAMRGVQGLLHTIPALRAPRLALLLTMGVVLLASLPGLARWLPKVRRLIAHAAELRQPHFAYQRAIDQHYQAAWQETQLLREVEAAAGSIYVFGDPLLVLLSGRAQASAVHGWAWELQPQQVWRRVEEDLRTVRPPFIFVDVNHDALLNTRGQGIRQLLDEGYTVRSRSLRGTWYQGRIP